MSTPVKLLLGFVALVALVAPAFTVVGFLYLGLYHPDAFFGWIMRNELLVTIITLGVMVVSYGPTLLYIILAGMNPGLRDRKPAWILLILFLSFLGIPLYWYFFIWQEADYAP
ncbi:MAG: PLDc N-terminal domain-containing protein [bacterium]|nr:PLDc N-terminal domain-containing protein [bacterium]